MRKVKLMRLLVILIINDNKGNILTVSQNGVLNNSYTYDGLDRLVREDNKDLNQTITYTYDTRGNILKKNDVTGDGSMS